MDELVGPAPLGALDRSVESSARAARTRWGLASVMTDMGARFRIGAAVVARLVRRGHAARRVWWSAVQSVRER